ncbi:MAG: hypothetical protein KDC39_09715 [Actinobacteria bacterium]|nr:hypothetical protein [Actinomycetota bacterium]
MQQAPTTGVERFQYDVSVGVAGGGDHRLYQSQVDAANHLRVGQGIVQEWASPQTNCVGTGRFGVKPQISHQAGDLLSS